MRNKDEAKIRAQVERRALRRQAADERRRATRRVMLLDDNGYVVRTHELPQI